MREKMVLIRCIRKSKKMRAQWETNSLKRWGSRKRKRKKRHSLRSGREGIVWEREEGGRYQKEGGVEKTTQFV